MDARFVLVLDGKQQAAAPAGKAGPEGSRSLPVLVVAAVGDAAHQVQLETFKVLVDHEVDHTGHGVGTIGSGRTAGDHVNPLQQGRRNVIDVHSAGLGRRRNALAVDQHQGAVRPQATQVQ